MFLTPFNYIVVYALAALGLMLIAARHLMIGIAGLLLIVIPIEVVLRWSIYLLTQ